MRKSIFIEDQVDVINHIEKNAIEDDVLDLVEEIKERIRLKRHKGVDKKINKLKGLAARDLDFLEEVNALWILKF